MSNEMEVAVNAGRQGDSQFGSVATTVDPTAMEHDYVRGWTSQSV